MKKSKIVRILAASVLLTLSLVATSFAARGDKEVDLSIGIATSSDAGNPGYAGYGYGYSSSLGTGFGLSVGGGYELLDITAIKGSTLQIRGDIGYNHWSESGFKLTRVPVSAGARLYVPIQAVNKLRVYGEASLELSFDSIDTPSYNIPFFGTFGGDSYSETNIGLVPGVGVEYVVAPNVFVGGGLKYHIISDGYLNALVGVGFKF
ncbi:MAG: outer membrane beta-barrel protein [Desulfuromonadaceae bacterium]